MKPKRSKAPRDLSGATRRWWAAMSEDYGIEDTGGLSVLTLAARARDTAAAAKAIIDREGMMTTDRFGCAKAHPAVAVERDARAQMLAALKALHLDLEPLRDSPGRPPGTFGR
jgi:hypothetical protein